MSFPWSEKTLKATPVGADEVMLIDSEDTDPETINKRARLDTIPSAGQTNTASNVGTGENVFKQKVGVNFEFRSLIGQTDKITLVENTDDITFTLGSDVVTIDKANTYEDFAQTFADDKLFIQNPAASFTYQILASAITADRVLTLPLLTGNDTFVFEGFAQTLTNKTIDDDNNIITNLAVSSLKDGTAGELITWDNLGVVDTVATGTAAQVLTSNGTGLAPTFQDVPSGLPVIDTTSIVQGSVDSTKQMRFEVDGFTTATTRVITPPDADITLVNTSDGFITNSNLTSGSFTNITGVGALTTGTWNADTITVPFGGTGAISFTDNAVLIGNATSAIEAIGTGTSGQVLISAGSSSPPAFGDIPTPALTNGSLFIGDENNISKGFPAGFETKVDCVVATIGDITLANTQVIDSVAVNNPDRVLVKNQTDATENGIYVVVDVGAWTRSTDADADSEVNNGMFTLVTSGTVNANTAWVLITSDPITVGSTNLTFDEFSLVSSGLPVPDIISIVEGSADDTKQLRFEIDGFTTATTRVLTPPDSDGTLVLEAFAQSLTNKTFTGTTNSFNNTSLRVSGSDADFLTIAPSALNSADRTVSFPSLSSNDTFALLGINQTFAGDITVDGVLTGSDAEVSQISLTTTEVYSLSDLPAPVSGVITLPTANYLFKTSIDFGTNRIVLPTGAEVLFKADNPFDAILSFTAASNTFITCTDLEIFRFDGVIVEMFGANGQILDLNNGTLQFFDSDIGFDDGATGTRSLGTIADTGGFGFIGMDAVELFGYIDGFTIETFAINIANVTLSPQTDSNTGTTFDLNGLGAAAAFDTMSYVGIAGSNIFDIDNSITAQINISNVADFTQVSNFYASGGLNQTSPNLNAFNNGDSPNSMIFGGFFVTSADAPVVSATFADIPFGIAVTALTIQERFQLNNTTNGEIEYTGIQDSDVRLEFVLPIDANSDGTSAKYEIKFVIDIGEISSAAVALGGTGYVDSEAVTLSGQTSGATNATATVSGTGAITAINIVDGASGYAAGETLDVIGGSGSGGTGIATLVGFVDIPQSPISLISLVSASDAFTSIVTASIRVSNGDKIKLQMRRVSGSRTDILLQACRMEVIGIR